MRIEPGCEVLDRWQVQRHVGDDTYTYVVAALDLVTQQAVELKTLHPRWAAEHRVHERFVREANALARIDSPHLARVLDVVDWKGLPVMVMEPTEGTRLSDLLSRKGNPRPAFIQDVLEGVLLGLKAAHDVDVLHLNIQPDQIVVSKTETGVHARLVGFGASGVLCALRVSPRGWTGRTIRYMSPELLGAHQDVDARADLYGVGQVAWTLLAGEPPWSEVEDQDALLATIGRTPQAPLPADAPRQLVALTRALTQADPHLRTSTAAQALRALGASRVVESAAPRSAPTHPPAQGGESDATRSPSRLGRIHAVVTRHWYPLLAAMVIVLATLGVLTWLSSDAEGRGPDRVADGEEEDAEEEEVDEFTLLAGRFERIPAGAFRMGSPPSERHRRDDENQVDVVLTRDFYLGRYPVTLKEYDRVTRRTRDYSGHCMGECPFYFRSWLDAVQYTNELNRRLGLEPCYDENGEVFGTEWFYRPIHACTGFRLPTEAEWEYAARAGTTGPHYGPLQDIAWVGGLGPSVVQPVGQKRPNAFGLYDMLGNTWEWVDDLYERSYSGGPDPQGPVFGSNRVLRGGSWLTHADNVRAAARLTEDTRGSERAGLRLARTIH